MCPNHVLLRSQTTIKTVVLYASIGIPTDSCFHLGLVCLVLELVTGDNSLSASRATRQRNMQRFDSGVCNICEMHVTAFNAICSTTYNALISTTVTDDHT